MYGAQFRMINATSHLPQDEGSATVTRPEAYEADILRLNFTAHLKPALWVLLFVTLINNNYTEEQPEYDISDNSARPHISVQFEG